MKKQQYFVHNKLPLDEVLSEIPLRVDKTSRMTIGDYSPKVASLRLVTFKLGKLCCNYCGIKATHFELNSTYNKHGNLSGFSPHLNMWAGDVLMTKDHVIPTAKGGVNHLNNLVTCCDECNMLKADIDLPSLDNTVCLV